MDYKILNDGNKMPIVGFGTFRLSGQECIDAVYNAIKAGYRLIDTAESYANEAEVGYAIAKCITEGIVTREELFITTKLNHHVPNNYEKTYKQFESSLKRLGLDYVDLYLIHYANVTPDARWKSMNAEDWRAMEELKKAGKIKSIGVSNFLQHHLEELFKTAEIMPAVNQLNLNPTWPQKELVKYCTERNILPQAWAPIVILDKDNKEIMTKVAEKYGKSTAQISLKWSLQKGFVPLAKTTHLERMKENLDIFNFDISDEDMAKLDTLLCHAYAHDAYPDATYTLWSYAEQLLNKNILIKSKFKLFNLIPLIKHKYKDNKEKIYLLGILLLIKKVKINDTKSKVYLFGFLRIGTEFRTYKHIEKFQLVPKWDKEEPKETLIKWNSFEDRHFKRIYDYLNQYSDKKPGKHFIKYLKLRYLITGKISIPSMDVHITTHCTLKCKDCSHRIPYYKKKDHHIMSLEEYKGYIETILKNVDRIYNVLLLGGEPFMHKGLADFIDYSCSKKQIQTVNIVTNGTLLPDEKLLNTLKKHKNIKVIISNYSQNKKIKITKHEELIKILKENNIKYVFVENFIFQRQPEIDLEHRVTDPVKLKNNFHKCYLKYCTILGQGKIYPCAQAKYIETLDYNMPKDSYIDLSKKNLKKDFINFFKSDCMQVCECCDMTHYGDIIFPAIQIENDSIRDLKESSSSTSTL